MNLYVASLVSSAIALAMVGVILILVLKLIQFMNSQNQMIQRLTNLSASKDLAAFTTLEASPPAQIVSPMPYVPMDDQSVSTRMAEQYAASGYNPDFAYGMADDPLSDFGGTEAFR